MAHCKISKQFNTFVWDDCTMAHKSAFEALNRTLHDLRDNNLLMGGITVLLAGDFHQTLPVVPRGTRADEIQSCLKSSFLWPIKNLALTKNMWVHLKGDACTKIFAITCLESEMNYIKQLMTK